MIKKATIEEAMYQAMKLGATVMPPDVAVIPLSLRRCRL